ncbi:preprotein translocase subunit SecE [Mycoplasmopsis agassizii]|uniref:Preprotein translocase subunit SecE n=1 Tax=Mycoplasmopsis agassizii TaxID=33922 RepID=A0ABX4H483_9BACT|nr:preprotein translocase subunit SecE [Mycoplasmopsis agassizii]PAF54686.1 preprotein translocase subunit SecE [Mycoplasmopsis agassizii]SMC16032.1 preprotein translocase subunit SecE [Mycoplasmopsis agassizii]
MFKNRSARVRKIRKRNWLWKQLVLFFKELKRVRWPKTRTSTQQFLKIIIFTVVFSLFVLAVATASSSVLNALGVGV